MYNLHLSKPDLRSSVSICFSTLRIESHLFICLTLEGGERTSLKDDMKEKLKEKYFCIHIMIKELFNCHIDNQSSVPSFCGWF